MPPFCWGLLAQVEGVVTPAEADGGRLAATIGPSGRLALQSALISRPVRQHDFSAPLRRRMSSIVDGQLLPRRTRNGINTPAQDGPNRIACLVAPRSVPGLTHAQGYAISKLCPTLIGGGLAPAVGLNGCVTHTLYTALHLLHSLYLFYMPTQVTVRRGGG